MFENIRKCLAEYEEVCNINSNDMFVGNTKDNDIYEYFHVNFAKAVMKDFYYGSDQIAKIILAAKGLSNEIKVKVE